MQLTVKSVLVGVGAKGISVQLTVKSVLVGVGAQTPNHAAGCWEMSVAHYVYIHKNSDVI